MKKFFIYFVLCLQISTICGMDARWIAGVTEEEVKAAMKKRKKLLPEEQKQLDTALCHNLRLYGRVSFLYDEYNRDGHAETFCRVHQLLLDGANPNAFDEQRNPTVLTLAIKLDFYRIVALLLAYGADPNLESPESLYWGLPITCIKDLKTLKLLVRAGAGINNISKLPHAITTPPLAVLCRGKLKNVVWPLSNGADPNIGNRRMPWGYPIYAAIHSRNLETTIALTQYKLQFTIKNENGEEPLDYADSIRLCRFNGESQSAALAIYEFLKAVSEHKLDSHYVYTLAEYGAMRISLKSAELIHQATQEVNEAFDKCALDDWKYDHPWVNLTKFVLDRQLRQVGRSRR